MSMWGTQLVYRKMGFVADFCQICISARPFVLERIGAAKHVFKISMGEGELVDYQRVCLHCSTAFRANPQQYAAIAKQIDTIEPLMLQTFPELAQAHAPRLQLEQQLIADPAQIDADTRSKLLLEPFLLLSPKVVKRFESAHFDVAHAFLRHEVIPLLGQTLARLRPSEAELQAALTQLVQMKDLIGAKLKLADLMADLDGRAAGKLPEVGAHPIKHYASGTPPYRIAAKIFKVLGWLSAPVGILMAVMAISDYRDGETALDIVIIISIVFLALPASMFAVWFGLERKHHWARVWAIVLSAALLFAFPIGTVIGGYVIWSLTAGWED